MENKELIELYKQVLYNFERKHSEFICNIIVGLNISDEDKLTLKEHFFTQIPTPILYKEIYDERTFNKKLRHNDSTDIWFIHVGNYSCNERNYKLRIKLLEAIIKNLEK